MIELVKASARHLTVVETAKLIRLTLKKRFPQIDFSVRSRKYSGGASIDIDWNDGARAKEVEAIVKGFEGASFDGMNDLKSYQDCWLLPDGTAQLAYRPDSCGGSIPEYVSDAPHPNAELVSFGANFVFCNRHITDFDAREAKALEYIRSHCACEGQQPNDRFGNEWVNDLAHRMTWDFGENETIEQTFTRVIINRT